MNDAHESIAESQSVDDALLDLFERITELSREGKPTEIQRLLENHPQYAPRLRALLPTMGVLAEMNSGSSRGTVAPPPLVQASTNRRYRSPPQEIAAGHRRQRNHRGPHRR